MNDSDRGKLNETVNLQRIIKTYDLRHKAKSKRVHNFNKYSLPIVFLRYIHKRHLSLEDADDKQSTSAAKLNNLSKGNKTIEKEFFWNNSGLWFSVRENVLNNFKSKLFLIKNLYKIPAPKVATEPTPEVATEPTKATKTNRKISTLILREEFLYEIKKEEKNINEQIFRQYFNYQPPPTLVKDLFEDNQNKSDMILKYLDESLIDLRNSVNSKEIPENINLKKVVNIVEKNPQL